LAEKLRSGRPARWRSSGSPSRSGFASPQPARSQSTPRNEIDEDQHHHRKGERRQDVCADYGQHRARRPQPTSGG
jgi:hypothetical protein